MICQTALHMYVLEWTAVHQDTAVTTKEHGYWCYTISCRIIRGNEGCFLCLEAYMFPSFLDAEQTRNSRDIVMAQPKTTMAVYGELS